MWASIGLLRLIQQLPRNPFFTNNPPTFYLFCLHSVPEQGVLTKRKVRAKVLHLGHSAMSTKILARSPVTIGRYLRSFRGGSLEIPYTWFTLSGGRLSRVLGNPVEGSISISHLSVTGLSDDSFGPTRTRVRNPIVSTNLGR